MKKKKEQLGLVLEERHELFPSKKRWQNSALSDRETDKKLGSEDPLRSETKPLFKVVQNEQIVVRPGQGKEGMLLIYVCQIYLCSVKAL